MSVAKAVEKGGPIQLATLTQLLGLLETKTDYKFHIEVAVTTGALVKTIDNERDACETIRRLIASTAPIPVPAAPKPPTLRYRYVCRCCACNGRWRANPNDATADAEAHADKRGAEHRTQLIDSEGKDHGDAD